MALIDITSYKNDLILALVSNPEILRLIDSQQPEYTPSDPLSVINTNIFGYHYVPETTRIADCYLLIECGVSSPSKNNDYFNAMKTTITVLCHQSRMSHPEGGTRTDKVAFEIGKMLDGKIGLGFGEFQLVQSVPDSLSEIFKFRMLTFNNLDAKESRYNLKPLRTGNIRGG
jgi:hypothetical protein